MPSVPPCEAYNNEHGRVWMRRTWFVVGVLVVGLVLVGGV